MSGPELEHALALTPARRAIFTDRGVKALKPAASRYEVIEPGRTGLRLRISPNGHKVWMYCYRAPRAVGEAQGKLRRVTIGPFPEFSLAEAREELARLRRSRARGVDPASARLAQLAGAEPTVHDLAQQYLDRHAKLKKRSWREDARVLQVDVLPTLGRRPARDVTRAELVGLLDRIVDRGAPIQANRTLALVRKMFNFAIERGLLEASPCLRIPKPAQEHSRDRVLSDEEIRTLWRALPSTRVSPQGQRALRLLLVTGQRPGEIARLPWAELDAARSWWTLPRERAKNGLAHRVPLTELAREILAECPEIEGSPFVFTSRIGSRPITEGALDGAVRCYLADQVIGKFTPRDLRRTAATGMASLGVPRFVVARVLNHAEREVTAVYDRHGYDAEKREALERWEAHLRAIIAGRGAVARLVVRPPAAPAPAIVPAVRLASVSGETPPVPTTSARQRWLDAWMIAHQQRAELLALAPLTGPAAAAARAGHDEDEATDAGALADELVLERCARAQRHAAALAQGLGTRGAA